MAFEIFRKPTDIELKDFQDINRRLPQDEFIIQLRKIEKDYCTKRVPFCARCAKFDFEDDLKKFSDELHRTPYNPDKKEGIIPKFLAKRKTNATNINIVEFLGYNDLSKYADISRFELLSESDAMENHIVDGMKQKIKVGTFLNFQCNERGCRHTITMTNKEYDERKAKAKAK